MLKVFLSLPSFILFLEMITDFFFAYHFRSFFPSKSISSLLAVSLLLLSGFLWSVVPSRALQSHLVIQLSEVEEGRILSHCHYEPFTYVMANDHDKMNETQSVANFVATHTKHASSFLFIFFANISWYFRSFVFSIYNIFDFAFNLSKQKFS